MSPPLQPGHRIVNIVVVSNLYPPIVTGGAELIASYLCEDLVRRGHRVTVVSTCGPGMEPFENEIRNGVRVVRFFPKNLYWFRARSMQQRRGAGRMDRLRAMRWHLRDAWNRDAARRIGPILDALAPDLVHSHVLDGFSASVWRQAARRRIPVLHTAHDYHLLCPRSIMLDGALKICNDPSLPCRAYRSWHLRTTRHVDLFASPSRFLLERHRMAGLLARDAAVVRNGIPMQPVARAPENAGRPRNRFLLMSQLRREKGIATALAAFARLPSACGAELTVCGQGPMEAEVREAAAADPRIRYLGFVRAEAKQAALARADHLLLPSLWFENAPVTILEAAANGLSVIGSRIGAIPEFVREGRTGLLFAPGDAEAMAAAMLRAIDDDALRGELAEGARALLADASVARMTDEYLAHYERLAHRTGALRTAA